MEFSVERLEKIKVSALMLEEKLLHYAKSNSSAASLHAQLKDLIDKAKQGQITQPVKSVPASYAFTFNETPLATKYPDLKTLYVKFKVEITMKDPDSLRKMVKKIRQENEHS